jgi:N-acetylneuraminic acid mutarotase
MGSGASGGASNPPNVVPSFVNETWEWDGEVWLPRLVSPRVGAMTMMAVGDKAVLYGEFNGEFNSVTTAWEWDGALWSELGLSARPPFSGAMASRGDKVVLFGGVDPGGNGNTSTQTWEWDGTRWSLRPTAVSPPALQGPTMAALGNKVVLFGGLSGSPNLPLGETWEWDGATWTKRTPAVSPPAGLAGPMVTVGDRVILFGGQGASGFLNDTWQWDGSTWTRLASPISPPALYGFALASLNKTVVLFGGFDTTGGGGFKETHDTWALTGGSWTQLTPMTYPPARSFGAMAGVGGEIVLFGGASHNDTWLLGGGP